MKLSHIQKDLIIPEERGILSRQGKGFHFSKKFARKNLYHLLWSSEYICDSTYQVEREKLNGYLLMNIVAGRMTVRTGGRLYSCDDSSLVLLDLRSPHMYRAETALQVQQFLINGNSLQAYYELFAGSGGTVFHKDSRIQFLLGSLNRESLRDKPDDSEISLIITNLLHILSDGLKEPEHDPVLQAKYYMEEHYGSNISLDEIAQAASLSKYYFSRLFERETGCPPWEYLTKIRLRNAMQMLTHSQASVEEIAHACGFSNSAGLIRVFRKYTNYTPGTFRKQFRDNPMGYPFTSMYNDGFPD